MVKLLISALLLDLILGDPGNKYHPVAYVGKFIEWLDRSLNRGKYLKLKGAFLVFIVSVAAYVLAYLMVTIAFMVNSSLGIFISIVIVWLSISIKKLAQVAISVSAHIKGDRLGKARTTVSQIVGRETRSLTEDGVSRAAIESVSENFVDSLVAPMFFAAIGGPPLAFAYRAVNTVDAMIGHKNEKYRLFGWAGARFDDLANYIPARMSVILLALSAFVIKANALRAFETAILFSKNHASPNSGFPEAAAAGALGVRLGGPSVYFGRQISHGYIGAGSSPKASDIGRSVKLVVIASVFTAAIFSLAVYLVTGKAF